MNSDRVKGAIDKVVGTAKRKTGELTGDTPAPDRRHCPTGEGKPSEHMGQGERYGAAGRRGRAQHDLREEVEGSESISFPVAAKDPGRDGARTVVINSNPIPPPLTGRGRSVQHIRICPCPVPLDSIAVEVAWARDHYRRCGRRPIGHCHILHCRRAARNQTALDRTHHLAAHGRGANDVRPHRQGDGAGFGGKFQATIFKVAVARLRYCPADGKHD